MIDKVTCISKQDCLKTDSGTPLDKPYLVNIGIVGGGAYDFWYESKEDRNNVFNGLINTINEYNMKPTGYTIHGTIPRF